jgi:addiction module HigA family antidote
LPGSRLEKLRGDRAGQYSIPINDQWRVCFVWREGHAHEVEIADYHWESVMAKKIKPVHPGEILREEFMKPLGLSMNKLSLDLRVPLTRIADIVNGRRRVTADTALRLARYFRNTPTFWMNLQTRYDLEAAADEIAARVARDVRPSEAIAAR